MTRCFDDEASSNAPAARVRVGAGYSYARTDLRFFPGSTSAAFERHAVVVTSEIPLGARSTLQIGSGGVAGGRLDAAEHNAVRPGWLAFASTGYRFVAEDGAVPFVLGSASIGAASSRTASGQGESAHLVSIDVRAGVVVGKTFGPASPYVAARVFGGPVYWTERGKDLTGTDLYHYQPAVGLVLRRALFDLFVEWAFAGERAVSAGLGLSF
jgi:hypothetical protein